VLIVVGIPALIQPILPSTAEVGRQAIFMVIISILFIAMCFAGYLGQLDGWLLLGVMVTGVVLTIRGHLSMPGIDLDEVSEQKELVAGLPKGWWGITLLIGLGVAVLQQITGINSVFFYAPMIFEQSGIGTDAAFSQAILVGLTNLVFTVVAILFIDKLGRKALLGIGMAGIAIFMFVLAAGFNSATYTLSGEAIESMSEGIDKEALRVMQDDVYDSDVKYKQRLSEVLGPSIVKEYESELIAGAIDNNPWLILIGILGFVASFAVSIGPVMWVLFSELFPNWIRGLAISFVGFVNSLVSFSVQLVFPWELATLGTAGTFLIYGIFGALGLVFVLIMVPETKGKSLEELEKILVK